MDLNRMTIKLQEALQAASAHAMRRSHQGIDVEHLLLSLLEQEPGLATSLLEAAGVSATAVKQAAEQALSKLPQVQGSGASPANGGLGARHLVVVRVGAAYRHTYELTQRAGYGHAAVARQVGHE